MYPSLVCRCSAGSSRSEASALSTSLCSRDGRPPRLAKAAWNRARSCSLGSPSARPHSRSSHNAHWCSWTSEPSLKPPPKLSTCRPKPSSKRAGAVRWSAAAKAHATLATYMGGDMEERYGGDMGETWGRSGGGIGTSNGLKKVSRCAATTARPSKRAGAGWPTVAKAHASEASSCGLNSDSRGVASAASRANSAGDGRPAAANAHAVLDSPCAVKSSPTSTDSREARPSKSAGA